MKAEHEHKIDALPPETRAEVDARLDLGQSAAKIWRDLQLEPSLTLRTFHLYAQRRRQRHRVHLARLERALLDKMLEIGELDLSAFDAEQRLTLAAAMREMLTSDRPAARLAGADLILQVRKDRRKERESQLRERVADIRYKLSQAADANDRAGKGKVVTLEEVARMLEAVDLQGGHAA